MRAKRKLRASSDTVSGAPFDKTNKLDERAPSHRPPGRALSRLGLKTNDNPEADDAVDELTANQELRKLLGLGVVARDEGELHRLSDAELITQLADTAASHELQVHGGILRFDSAVALNNYVEDNLASTPMQSGPMSRQTNTVEASSDNTVAMPASLNDVVLASAAAIQDINDIMAELQAARDQLEADAERVWLANTQYVHLAKTASASAKSITEILGQWLEHERFGGSRPPQTSADQERHPQGNEG
jgi:hypothetical protein